MLLPSVNLLERTTLPLLLCRWGCEICLKVWCWVDLLCSSVCPWCSTKLGTFREEPQRLWIVLCMGSYLLPCMNPRRPGLACLLLVFKSLLSVGTLPRPSRTSSQGPHVGQCHARILVDKCRHSYWNKGTSACTAQQYQVSVAAWTAQ